MDETDIDDLKNIEINIEKTGFVHEHRVSSILQDHGWIVINSKRYVDNIERKVRAIDIVAYKHTKNDHMPYYTVLIVSCKKSNDNIWALISRDKSPRDPNTNWFPLHIWSNAISINFMMRKKSDWRADYVKTDHNLFERIFSTESHIFAFQEMHKKTGVKINDNRIFSSIDSLIKAQSYELAALPERKKDGRCFYSFNLLTIVDAPLIKVHLEPKIKATRVDEDRYIANYIVNGKEISARIHFVEMSAIDHILTQYDRLHKYTVDFFGKMRGKFFNGIMQDYDRRCSLIDMFRSELGAFLYFGLRVNLDVEYGDLTINLDWDDEKKIVLILLSDDNKSIDASSEPIIAKLNNDDQIMKKTAQILSQLYKYHGGFQFAIHPFVGIPF